MLENYSLWDHGGFLRDEVRVRSYVEALREAVSDGCLVLEVGSGTAFFAAMAASLGASHVDAVEPDSVIYSARGILEANQLEDKVTLYHGNFADFISESEQQYDVILSDLRGCLPYYGDNLVVAREGEKLLADHGRIIPCMDEVFVAPISDSTIYRPYSAPWQSTLHGIDLRYCASMIVQRPSIVHAAPEALLASPRLWSKIDYTAVTDVDHSATLSWAAERPGTMHGYLAWFESALSPGIRLNNRPGEAQLVYGQQFFPLPRPITVAANDKVVLTLSAAHSDRGYMWQWETKYAGASQTERFSQSSSELCNGQIKCTVLHLRKWMRQPGGRGSC